MNWTLLKLKTCALIDTINRVKRQAPEWEKVFEKHVSDKGLVEKKNIKSSINSSTIIKQSTH